MIRSTLKAVSAAALLAGAAGFSAFAADAPNFAEDAPSGLYKADQGHRYIAFTYSHQGFSNPIIAVDDWTADLNWDAADVTKSTVNVTIQTASIDTGVEAFDKHIKSGDMFDVEKHPTITFTSTSVEKTGDDTGKITGDLTIKGVTKPVVLDATFNKAAFVDRAETHKIGFSAKTTIMRSEFGVDYAVPFVGDAVEIVIESEFDRVKDE
ncbi:MAG: YceI family protein [Pseudomonadota bacterium]